MPNYEVEHIVPLTEAQKDELAEAITKIHSDKFSTPKLFVNIRFTNIKEHAVYLAGKRRLSNRIFAYVRHGPSRTQEDYADVSSRLQKAWDEIVPLPQIKRSAEQPDTELRMVMFFGIAIDNVSSILLGVKQLTLRIGAIQAVYEAGFMLPQAGGDAVWLKENMTAFQSKADNGDEEIKDMIDECKARGLV